MKTDMLSYMRIVRNFPRKGQGFSDITLLFQNKRVFNYAINELAKPFRTSKIDKVIGIETRGLVLGGCVATKLRCGFVPVLKLGKLPYEKISLKVKVGKEDKYRERNFGLEIHKDAIKKGERILIVDDWFGSGKVASTAIKLVKKLGGKVVGLSVLFDSSDKKIKGKFRTYRIHSLRQLEDKWWLAPTVKKV